MELCFFFFLIFVKKNKSVLIPSITILLMEKSLRQKELYWYHKLNTYVPLGLNKRDAHAGY